MGWKDTRLNAVSKIRVAHLGEHRAALPEIVGWLHAEWGHLMPDSSAKKLESIFEARVTHLQIPEAFVALLNGKIVGTASLVSHDLPSRKDLTPWLAAVYVKPEARDRGIGSRLVRAVMDEVAQLELPCFYLITPDRSEFYARLGWQEIDKTEYRAERVSIMVYEIC